MKGESKNLTFTITPKDLKFYNNDLKWVLELGDFKVFVGTNSEVVEEGAFRVQ